MENDHEVNNMTAHPRFEFCFGLTQVMAYGVLALLFAEQTFRIDSPHKFVSLAMAAVFSGLLVRASTKFFRSSVTR